MFIKLKTNEGRELNINVDHIMSFTPDNEVTKVMLSGYVPHLVQESCRSIRHAIKKASSTVTSSAEADSDS